MNNFVLVELYSTTFNSRINITVPLDQQEVKLNNLQGYTNYSVQVLAITLHEGPLSDPLYIFTKETGMFVNAI